MKPFLLLIFLMVLSIIEGSKFLINTDPREFNDPQRCPRGYKLADLNDQTDWQLASQLAIDILGPDKAAWIASGHNFKGSGREQWTLLTPIPPKSCRFPPKDLDSFCLPIYWTRMSPNLIFGIKFPSICQEETRNIHKS